MNYISHYIWESGSEEKENPISVVLQQVSGGKQCWLLGCVCDGRKSGFCGSMVSGYFTERLVEWFHHYCVPMRGESVQEQEIYRSLTGELSKIEQELGEYGTQKEFRTDYDVWGILMQGSRCWIFGKGTCKGYLFNRRWNKAHRKLLEEFSQGEMTVLPGEMQKEIGILLCSSGFDSHILSEEMLQVLFEEKLTDREIGRGLRELWRENVCRGEKSGAGAVYIRVE